MFCVFGYIKKVLPGLEPGSSGSEPEVLTNYTIEPVHLHSLGMNLDLAQHTHGTKMRPPGIEPGSITWQATIITTRPRTHTTSTGYFGVLYALFFLCPKTRFVPII